MAPKCQQCPLLVINANVHGLITCIITIKCQTKNPVTVSYIWDQARMFDYSLFHNQSPGGDQALIVFGQSRCVQWDLKPNMDQLPSVCRSFFCRRLKTKSLFFSFGGRLCWSVSGKPRFYFISALTETRSRSDHLKIRKRTSRQLVDSAWWAVCVCVGSSTTQVGGRTPTRRFYSEPF